MNIGVHKIEYKDSREFSTELEFIIACDRVSGKELINISLINTEKITSFKNFITRHLKSMKRDGIIKLFVFENEINNSEKTECIYLLNKFPSLAETDSEGENSVYIML